MKKILRFFLKILFWFVFASVLIVLVYRWVPVHFTPLMLIRAYQNNTGLTWKHHWVELDHISKNLQLAVICSEDQKFLEHNGFDINAIEKAYYNNKKAKRIKGGSTISQQTAKNVFLWPQRSWLRKGMETYFTFLIEWLWPKERILEVYLNSIEMGKNVYGADAAAQYWFYKKAAHLNEEEAAAIAAILPKPLSYKATPATSYIEKRKNWIRNQMHYFGPFKLDK